MLIATVNAQPPPVHSSSLDTEQTAAKSSDDVEERDYAASLLELAAIVFTLRERRSSSAILSMIDTASGFSASFLDKYVSFQIPIPDLTLKFY